MAPSRIPELSDNPYLPGYTTFPASWNAESQSIPGAPAIPRNFEPHPPGIEVPSHNSNPTWTSIAHPWTSHVTSPTKSRTPRPSELLPRSPYQEYSAAWDPNANTPPLPVAAARFENFGRARGACGPSGLSSVVSTSHNTYGSYQRNQANKTNSPDYYPTSPPGPMPSTEHSHPNTQRQRSLKDAFKTPDRPLPLESPSPFSTDQTLTQGSINHYRRSGKMNTSMNDRNPARLATERLWQNMYQRDDAAEKNDLALVGQGASDIEVEGMKLR